MNDLLQKLQEPFPPAAITWKPGATTKDGTKCMAMAYGDLRTYMERLDQVCGLDWSVRYEPWGNERIIACVTIAGVTRSSIGEYGKQDEQNNIEGTVAEAQAFKRACAMFGLGRYLYDLPSVWVPFDAGAKKISVEGQAQLDARYKTWYTKTMAERKAQRQNAPATSQQPQATIEGANVDGDALFATEGELVLLFEEFNTLGIELYAEQWPLVRKRNAKRISGGATQEASALPAEQIQRLIDGMKTVKAKKTEMA